MASNRYASTAAFRAALRRFLRTSENAARAAGITPGQHLLLLQIAGCDGATATVSGLVDTLALTQSAVTELVQRAEQAGLVHRAVSASDGRVAVLSLTAAGEAKLAQVHDTLGPERAELRRVVDALDG
ncbi:MAG TPA: MarR family winged helix-turn-helix transcriptional regulator [Gaiellaceae bacterium]|nr:MarR family winged helix-turn-helix transcriptional regulator [Gaiellaceae bacterium]